MSDRQLADIGITRSDIDAVVSGPLAIACAAYCAPAVPQAQTAAITPSTQRENMTYPLPSGTWQVTQWNDPPPDRICEDGLAITCLSAICACKTRTASSPDGVP